MAFLRGVPVILLQKIRDAVFVPVLPAYVSGARPTGGLHGRYVVQVVEVDRLDVGQIANDQGVGVALS